MRSWLKVVIVMIFAYVLVIAPCLGDDNIYPACTSLFTEITAKTKPRDILYKDTTNKSVKNLTKNFCAEASSFKCMDTSAGELSTDYFDASQSIFLTILCEHVLVGDSYSQTPYSQTKAYLNKSGFVDFGIITSITGTNEKCYWKGSMNSCDYAYNLPLIFNKIMNDFFSIKQARSFGINILEKEFDSKVYANNFSKEYFVGLEICKDNGVYYKTACKKLKNYMIDARNLLRNTEVINVSKLQAADCDNNRADNLVYCGLLGNSDYWYINAIYNEYFWYNLFLTYYSIYIEGTDFLDGSYSKDSDKVTENADKIALVQDQLQKSKKAITLSLRTLAEITDSFPLHVGFLMYQDDALMFMEKLAKIYPPIRTLYDKLRNVQIKES